MTQNEQSAILNKQREKAFLLNVANVCIKGKVFMATMDKCLFNFDTLKDDSIRAVDAKGEAQRIAFSPLTFCAVNSMIELGVLKTLEEAGDKGTTQSEIAAKCNISEYAAKVLLEMALLMGVARLQKDKADCYTLGKVGWMLINDELTRVNFNFSRDVCYKGAFDMSPSLKEGKPKGLAVFGNEWHTVYEALSKLPKDVQKSWFDFDHFYSDIAFPEALPIIFSNKVTSICDIGGNTAKFSIAACKFSDSVNMTIVDLPGQVAVAKENAKKAGFSDRIKTFEGNILDNATTLPANQDVFWMSQFLDCFSLEQVTAILQKINTVATDKTLVYVLEPLWDMQHFSANAYSLVATSLYFTCIANGNSKMYRYDELKSAIEKGGFTLCQSHHNLGSNSYSLLAFKKSQ